MHPHDTPAIYINNFQGDTILTPTDFWPLIPAYTPVNFWLNNTTEDKPEVL